MIPWRAMVLVATTLVAGCAGETFAPDAAPFYRVTEANTPFYRFGPQQTNAPEARLQIGEEVRMLRREFGYSFVQLPQGMTGYVANDSLEPAPTPPPTPEPTPKPRKLRPRGTTIPVIDVALPEPDLGAPLPDLPALEEPAN